MTKTIQQRITFKALPQELFEAYIDPKKYSAFTNTKVSISRKVGQKFAAYDGYINVPDHMYSSIKKGWYDYYWKPLKAYISRSRKR